MDDYTLAINEAIQATNKLIEAFNQFEALRPYRPPWYQRFYLWVYEVWLNGQGGR